MLKIFKYFKSREWGLVGASLLFVIAQVWLDLRLPEYMSEITTLIQTEGSAMGDILYAGGKMLLCALGSLASSIIVGYFAAKLAARFSRRLRRNLYYHIQMFSMEEINQFSRASLITRSTNDITQIQMFVAMGLQVIVKAPIMAIMAIGKIQSKGNFEWSMLTAGAVIFLLVVIISIMAYAVPKFRRIQGLTDNLNRITSENLSGLRVVRAYNAEDYQNEKFEEANNALCGTQLKAQLAMAVMNPTMSVVMNGVSLGVYWIGAYLINAAAGAEKLNVFSNMVVFSSYAMQVIMAFTLLTMIFIMLPRMAVSARRINEVLDTPIKIKDGAFEGQTGDVQGEVEFKNVSFKYPDAEDYVLHNISFTAHKGQTVALIGATGSGKSSIIHLIPRFFDTSEGEVLVDGVNVKDYKLSALRSKLGYVSQKAVLFSGTVASNVSMGDNGLPKPDDGAIQRAIDIAQSADFVAQQPDGIHGHVAQNGANFSGGQKQRLSIARAICRKPEIYIFDDSFSALDYKTDRALREALKRETSGVTNIIVAQRIGTIMDADRILVIHEGRIVGDGKHSELLKHCEVYQEIAASQLSKEELSA